jgi:cytochrome P460
MSGPVIALAGLVALVAAAGPADAPYYPDGYRTWRVAKFKLIGPDHPNYEKQGGFRHHFANDIAIASWGHFSDGAAIVDERVHAKLEGGIWQEGDLAFVGVMRKDAARFADTGGWEWNLFRAGDTRTGLTREQAKQACFDACHKNVADRDFVFSDPRR